MKEAGRTGKIQNLLSWLVLGFPIALLGLAFYFRSIYTLGCCCFLIWLGISRLWLDRVGHRGRTEQKRACKLAGLLMFPPALGLCGLSTAQMLTLPIRQSVMTEIWCICALVAAQAAVILAMLILNRGNRTTAGKTGRFFDYALLCVLMPVLVSQLLWLGEQTEWAQMTCLTGCVMGGTILLLGLDLLLCAFAGYKSTRESIRVVQALYKQKRRLFHIASAGKDGVMVLTKLIMSIVSTSFFMFANALFSCGIGVARYTALQIRGKDWNTQLKLYRRVSLILMFAGICYVGYSVRLFFGGTPGQYGMIMALIIALYTFVEFGVQIREIVKLRKLHDLEAEALRLISFSSILVSFVLTQTAIMSFSEPGDHAWSDGLSGVLFGSLVVLVGVVAQFRHWHHKKRPF